MKTADREKAMDREIEQLRRRANIALQGATHSGKADPAPSDMADAMRLVEELRVYQTELEIQNLDLKAAQLQTEVAMKKYKRLFENLPLESLIIDAQGFIVEANAVARERFGLRQQASLQRRSVYQIFAMDSRVALHVALTPGKDLAHASRCQLVGTDPESQREVDAHVITLAPDSLIDDDRLMVLVDRTFERKLALQHEAMSRSEERYRALFDRSKVPMLLIEPVTGLIVRANASAQRFYGYDEQALNGMPIAQINCLNAEETHSEMKKAQTEHRDHFFFSHRLASGRVVPVEVHSGPIEIDGRTLLYSIIHDITARLQAEQKLAEFNRDFEAFLDQTSDFVYFKNRDSRFKFCSQTMAAICGFSDWREMTGKHDLEVFPLENARIYQEEEAPIFAEGKPLLNQIDPYFDATGKPGFVQTNKWPLFDENGQVTGIFGISRNVTESLRVQARLQLAASVFTHAREGILITDASNTIIEVNDAFTRVTGYQRDEVIGCNPRILKSGGQNPEFYQRMWQSLGTQGHWEGEVWNRRKDGARYAELLSISAVRDNRDKVLNYVALFTDISLQKEHQSALEHIARYDQLTGLPNRALLADRLQQEMAHCLRRRKQLAVVFIDLDGFKQVNDQHGHDIGDQLLIALSHRMKTALREGDTLSRIGGDEFVAVLSGLDQPKDCEIILTRLLQAAAEPVTASGFVLRVSASIGVTLFPQDAADADQLLRHADHAMYQAKQSGKNRYHYFDVKDDAEVKSHRESLEEISAALDRSEFVLHYQPKVNMRTGAVIGMEALIRWQHPRHGLLLPAKFLPTLNGHPLSIRLGDWVIHTAVQQIAEWNAGGLKVAVSVNIDALHLQQATFVKTLSQTLNQHPGVLPGQLDLEVLETSAMDDIEKVSAIMRQCCELGVGFSLDDFGTGYSSLTYLKRLPADLMKIDQSFVIGMIQDSDDFVIVEGVVGLARAFGRNVLAEGVETIAHGELLLALGCELGQGYGIAHAMSAAAVPGWVLTWQADARWCAWNEQSHIENNRDLVLAEIKHRHWLRDVENYVTGKTESAPPLSIRDCQMGKWVMSHGTRRYGHHVAFEDMNRAHEQVHAVAQQLVELFHLGEHQQIAASLPDLNVRRDALINAIHQLGTTPA
jgi:diguanylate cyclase (GGDEF)-like protein/PAS domain S-box-containing protein